MKQYFLKFLLLYFCLTTSFLSCANISTTIADNFLEKSNKTDFKSEIENCVFLEKKLLPQKITPILSKKLLNLSIQAGISITAGIILSKISSFYLLSKQKSNVRKKISPLIFIACSTVLFFLLKYLIKPKEITDFERLKNFIKAWPVYKNNIPAKFREKFENIFILYRKHKKLPLSEEEAEKFVKKIIMETIDYKIYLQYKQSNF